MIHNGVEITGLEKTVLTRRLLICAVKSRLRRDVLVVGRYHSRLGSLYTVIKNIMTGEIVPRDDSDEKNADDTEWRSADREVVAANTTIGGDRKEYYYIIMLIL